MRLRDMLNVLQRELPRLQFKWESVTLPGNEPGRRAERTLRDVLEALDELEELPFLRTSIETLKLKHLALLEGLALRPLTGTVNAFDPFVGDLSRITELAMGVGAAFESVLPPEDANSVTVKLPAVADLDELAKFVRELQLVFNQPILTRFGSHPKFDGFDTGSCWVTFGMETKEATIFMVLLFGSALYLLKQRRDARPMRDAQLAAADPTDVPVLEKVWERQDDQAVDKAVQLALPDGTTPEELNGARIALKQLTGMAERGVELLPASNATQPIQEQFAEVMAIQRLIDEASEDKAVPLLGGRALLTPAAPPVALGGPGGNDEPSGS